MEGQLAILDVTRQAPVEGTQVKEKHLLVAAWDSQAVFMVLLSLQTPFSQ